MDAKFDSYVNFLRCCKKVAEYHSLQEDGNIDILTAESICALVANLVNKNWENLTRPAAKKERAIFELLDRTEARCTEKGGKYFMAVLNEAKMETEVEMGFPNQQETLSGTGIHKIQTEKKTRYVLETEAVFEIIREFAKLNDLTRGELLQGAALALLCIETREAAVDCSFSSFKVRNIREQSGAKMRGRDEKIVLTTENIRTGHMTGITLPSKSLRKAIWTNIGAGVAICEGASARLKMLSSWTTDETRRLARQELDSLVEMAREKLGEEQLEVYKNIKMARTAETVINIVSLVGTSLDAMWPRVDKPVIVHPVYFLNDSENLEALEAMTGKTSLYDTAPLALMGKTVKAIRMPGYNSMAAIQQSLAMASITGLYGQIALIEKAFNLKCGRREMLIQELKYKYSGSVGPIRMQPTIPQNTVNFTGGLPSAVKHQYVLHPSIAVKSDQFPVYDSMSHRRVVITKPYIRAVRDLTTKLRSIDFLKQEREKWLAACGGPQVTLTTEREKTTGYFNDTELPGEEAERNKICETWLGLLGSMAHGATLDFQDDEY